MRCSLQFNGWLTCAGLRRAFAPPSMGKMFTAIVCAGLASHLLGQSSAPTPAVDQAASATLPAAPSPAARTANPFAARSAPVPALDSGNPGFGQNQPPMSDPSTRSRRGSRSGIDPFQPGLDPFQPSPNFGTFAGATGSAGQPSIGGFNQIGGSGRIGIQSNFGPLFPASDGPGRGVGGPFGSAPAAPPSLNQLMRESFSLPFTSSPKNFRFTYLDTLRPGGPLGDLGRPNTSAMFTTSDLGNGVFLSAGTGYGIRSAAGAPAAAFGTEGGPKHSGTAVNLKLSF